jgi:hypothetical protein
LNGIFEDGFHLFFGDAGEPRQEVIDRRPAFEVLEERDYGDACAAKDPTSR